MSNDTNTTECIAEGHDMGDCCDIDCPDKAEPIAATPAANATTDLQPRAAAWANHHYPADVAKLIAALNETASSLVFDALRQDYARDTLPDDLAAMLVTLLAIADMIEVDLIALVERKIQ